MSSFKDLVKQVNEGKIKTVSASGQKQSSNEKEEEKKSSFRDLVKQVNDGSFNVSSKLKGSDVSTWYSKVSDIGKRSSSYLSGYGYKKADTSLADEIETYLSQAADVGQFIRANKSNFSNYDDTISTYYQAVNYLRDLKSGVKSSNEYYSQWKSEEDYNSYVAQQKDYEAKKSFDVSAGEKEITELKKKRSELANATTSRQPASSYLIGSPVNATSPYAASQSSGTYNKELADLDALISQKSAYLNQAKRIQEGITLSGAAGNADFTDYSGYVSTKSDNAWDRLWSQYDMGYDDLTYEYINNKNGIRNEIKQKSKSYSSDSPFDDGESIFEEKGYDFMNHSEISIYNYYYAKEGKEAAEKYLDSIQESLNLRKATSMYGNLEDNTALELAFGIAAGLDQFESGVKNLFNSEDSYIPQTATQMASGMVREDLADVGPKLPDWLGGASIGQVGYDTITTTSNMAPSIMTSMALGIMNPAAGQWAGTALMGASAAGNAYQEALNMGYDKGQARMYAALVGGSEAGLQYLLGGIGSLGGKLSGNAVTKIMNGVDNAFARTAIKLGGNMLSEGVEEGLQEILTPWFQNLIMHTNEDINWSEVAYSTLLGALTAGFMEGGTTISGEVNTYKTGKQLQAADISAQRLAEIGNTFSADTVAHQLAGKVDENTGAYTMGRLFNEIGATLTEQNVNDLTQALVENGMTEDMANKNAEVMAYIIEGGEVSNFQMRMIEKNEILSKVMKEVIIDPNSTLNQRNKGYNDALMALAQEKTGSDAPQTDTAEPAQENAPAADKVDAPEEIVSEAAPAASDDALMAVAESVAQDQQNKSGTVGSAMFTNENQRIVAEHYSNLEATTDNPVIANMDVASRNKLTAAYDPASGMIPKAYVVGSNEAFYYGFEGIPMTTMSKTSIAMALSPEQRAYAYNLGVEAAQRGVEAQSAAMGAAYAKAQEVLAGQGITTKNGTVIVKKKGAGGKAILETSIKESSMTRQQKASYKLADAVAKAVGTDIHVYAGMTEYGKYDEETGEIWLNVNANISGQSMMAFTLGHELVHMAKQWSPKKFKAFADFLLAEYGKKGVAIDALIQEQIDNAQRNGIYLDPHAAYEEVIADACQRMLLDSDAVKKMAAFKEQNPDTWNRIKQAIEKFINKIRAYFKGAEPDSQEAQLYKELDDAAKKILENMFVDMVMDAGEHLSTIRNAFGKGTVVEANENGEFTLAKSKDGSKFLYNDYTWERGGRDTLAAALKAEGFSQEDIDAALTIMDGKHKLVKELGKKFPEQNRINEATITTDLKDGHSVLSALVSNGDYPVNIDLLMVCKKRKAYQRVINRLCETGLIQQATVDALAIAEINKILGKYGFETACLGCFVESRRLRIQEWAQTICKEWNAEVKKRNPNAKAFGFGKGEATLTQDEVMQLIGQLEAGGKKNDQGNLNLGQGSAVKRMGVLLDKVPALRKTLSVEDLITPDGLSSLRRFDSNLFSMVKSRYGSNSPKFVQEFNPYNHELAMYGTVPAEYSSLREYLYAIGGARMQSFSDFIVENWFDYCQIVADLAARKLPMHTYTKEIALVKLLGMTGIKINMSLIPDIDRSLSKEFAGLTRNADGELELIWSDKDRFKATGGKSYMQSINFNDAMALQNDPRYSANVGTIAIGVSDIQIRMMLNDPRIRMVIPYHSSGMNPIFADLMGTSYYKDYTLFQNTTVKQLYNSKGQKVSLKLDKTQAGKLTSGFQFNEVLQELGDARAAAEAYKEWCADASKHTITIKGETYTAELTPKFDDFSGEKNYYKLLEDFNTYDCISEQAAPQGDVQQIYPEDFNKILEDELKSQEKHRQKQIANQAFDKAMSEIEAYLRTHTKADTVFYAEQHGVSISAKDKKLNAEDKKKLAELRKGVKNSLPKVKDTEYLAAVKRGDMETAQRMVDEDAKKAGLSIEHLYHGTPAFGFTTIDTSESDDSISFFATNNPEVAQGYMPWYEDDASDRYHNEPRRIGKDIKKRAITNRTSIENVVKVLNETFDNQYKNARAATDKETLDSFKLYHIPEMVDAAAKLIDRNVPQKIKDLCRLVVEANEKDTFAAWSDVAKRYKEFETAEIPYDPFDWSNDILWSRVVVDLQSISKMARTDPIWNDGSVIMKSALIDRYNTYLGGEGIGMYDFYGNNKNQLVIWGEGSNWKSIPLGEHDAEYRKWLKETRGNDVPEGRPVRASTRDISAFAKHMGYRSAVFVDIYDAGAYGERGVLSDVYSFFYPQEDIKSADPVTYDDQGNVIPLSERFNPENQDIRYSLPKVDSEGKQLTKEQQEFFKNSKVRDANGNLIPMYHGTNTPNFTVFDPRKSDDHISLFFTSDPDVANTYTHLQDKGRDADPYNLITEDSSAEQFNAAQERVGGGLRVVKITPEWIQEMGAKAEKSATRLLGVANKYADLLEYNNSLGMFSYDIERIREVTGKGVESLKTDDINKLRKAMGDAEQHSFFAKDHQGAAKEIRRIWKDNYDLFNKVWNYKIVAATPDSAIGQYTYTETFSDGTFHISRELDFHGHIEPLTEKEALAKAIERMQFVEEHHLGNRYKVYLNITNPYVIDASITFSGKMDSVSLEGGYGDGWAVHFENDDIDETRYMKTSDFNRFVETAFDAETSAKIKAQMEANNEAYRKDWPDFDFDPSDVYHNIQLEDVNIDYVEPSNWNDLRDSKVADYFDWEADEPLKTRDVTAYAKAKGYDGVIFKNMKDAGGYAFMKGRNGSTVVTAFSSEQVKSVDNKKPTANKDMRYSLPKIEKPTDNKYIKMVEDGATHIGEYDVVPKSKEPKKTILAWKALVVKPGAKNNPKDKSYGNMYPPQVHQVASTPYGVWLYANEAPKKLDKDGNPVLTKFGRPKVKEGMTYRPAWHFGDAPYASQFMSHAYGFFDDNGVQRFYMSESKGILVWALCEMAADENYQDEADMAGHVGDDRTWDEQQASLWYLPENGYYKYMTNRVDPNSVTWYLSDKMRIVQTITDAEMREILTWIKEDGSTDLEFNYPLRLGGKDVNPADYGIPVGNVVGDGIDYVDRWKNQFREIAMNGDIDITQSHFYYVPSTATNYGSYETVSFSKEVDDHSQELLKTKKDAKILSVNSGSTSGQTKNFEAATGVKVKEAKTLAGRKKIIEAARKEGYDIVEFKTEGKLGADVVIVNPDAVIRNYKFNNVSERHGRTDAVKYSKPKTSGMSSRQLLADAFDELVQTPKERQLMDQYRANISKVEEVQDRLKKVRGKIRELSKGNGNKAKIDTLNKTAADLAKLIDSYDRKLLEMEASKPLRDVLARAKSDAYQKAKQRGEEHLKKYQEKVSERFDRGVENRNKTAMKHKIQNVVKELNDLLLNESKKRHVPDSLKKAVASALAMVNMDTVGAEERAAKYAALIAKEEAKANPDQDKIDAYTVTMENIIRKGEKMGQRLKELRDAYEEIQESDDPDIANAYDPVIAGCLKELSQSIGDTPLRNMTIEQLSDVYDMYRMVLTRVRDANKTLLDNIRESISILASSVIGEVRKAGGEHKYRLAALDPVTKFMWNNLKPVYAMEHIGSATLTKVFDNVRAGEDTWAKDVTEAREYYLEKSKKYGYDSWDFDKKYRFQSASDLEFELTLEQVLSLYAYSKREQAHDHLRLGGFVFDSNIETYKDGKLIKYKVNTADAHQITPEILAEIIGTLTDKQKGFVDEMQDYLSTVMGAKGNEVTMKMYGVKLFKEKFYFPLKSAKQFMFEQNEVSGEVKIKNSGFTNKVVAKANNPVILSNFMEVWSGHVNDMSMYHAFVLPLEDFNRVFNYNSPKRENQPSVSVKGTIQSAYSPAAVHYVKNLITDLNGGARSDSTAGVINKMMGLFKKGAVFASLSVVVQQPSAIARAAALVDMKYFIGPKVDRKRHSLLWDEVKRYAPVAIIKEMGYFDTNMGKSTQDFITGKEYSSISEKMKALVTDSDYRDEVLSKAPALADEIAWCAIWDAVKREMHDKHPGLDVKGEPFLMLAGSRFTEVITKTQVYDSVLSRSANMRSKDTGMKMATSFMAEPTTSINMIADALLQGKRGNRKYCISAIGAVIASNILNSILVSFVYAGRDDDEDETYVEKYIGTLTAEILDGMNPATYIPFIKDIVSIVQGYDVERSDMAVVSDLWNAYQKLGSSKLSTYRKVEGFAGSIAQIFGLPVKNIMRDVRGIYQTVMSFVNGQQTTKAGIGYAVKSAIPEWLGGGDVSNQEQLYNAYLSGYDAHLARVESRYKDESAVNSAMRSAIKDHYLAGDISSETAKDHLVNYAATDDDDAFWKAEEWEYESETGEDFNKYNEFLSAVETGKNLKAVIKQYTDNGVKESTLKSKISEHFKPLYIEMSNSERAGIKGYLLNAMTLLGDTREYAEEKIAKWQYEADYPELADRITYTQYTRWQTDGKPNGVSLELYTDVAEFRDDGTSNSAKSQEEVAAYIDSLPISTEQKDALWCCFWKESTLKKAPWH